jgi:hypothetical protein
MRKNVPKLYKLLNFQHLLRQPPRNTFNADYESDAEGSSTNGFEIKRNDTAGNSLEYYPFPTTLDR